MVTQLKAEQADERKHFDFCVSETESNKRALANNAELRRDLEAKHKQAVSKRDEEKAAKLALETAVAETTKKSERAGDTRALQNDEFQKNIQAAYMMQDMM